jgi:hypothetical protein
MAFTTKIIERNLLMLGIVFTDGMTVTVTAGRDGRSVIVTPEDRGIADRLSSIFNWSADKVGEPGYPFTSLNQLIYGMETLARSAMNVEQFIAGLREVLEVSGGGPAPNVEAKSPSFTIVDLSPSGNGWFVDARFQNGERFKLIINRASIGWSAEPPDTARDNDVMSLLSGLKSAQTATDEELALLAMEVANYSADIAGWIAALRATLSAGTRS